MTRLIADLESHRLEAVFNNGWDDDPAWKAVCECGWEVWDQPGEIPARSHHATHVENIEKAWYPDSEPATPLYIGPLPHYTRRMLQALDGYWLHCDGLPKGRHPRSRSTAEDWWTRFEKYREKVEGRL